MLLVGAVQFCPTTVDRLCCCQPVLPVGFKVGSLMEVYVDVCVPGHSCYGDISFYTGLCATHGVCKQQQWLAGKMQLSLVQHGPDKAGVYV